jgi:hypothetical protein
VGSVADGRGGSGSGFGGRGSPGGRAAVSSVANGRGGSGSGRGGTGSPGGRVAMGSVADGRGSQDEKATKSPSKMNYRELQKECKRLGLKATGRADELRQQLLNGPIPESEAALEAGKSMVNC